MTKDEQKKLNQKLKYCDNQDEAALKKLEAGERQPLLDEISFYLTSRPFSGITTYFNEEVNNLNIQRPANLILKAREVLGTYNKSFEQSVDSIYFLYAQSLHDDRPWSAQEKYVTLYTLIQKEYSPEVPLYLATCYQQGRKIFTKDGGYGGYDYNFDSVYYYTHLAAVRGSSETARSLADLKMFGNGSMWEKPTAASFKYIDSVSAKIWYKKVHDSKTYGKVFRVAVAEARAIVEEKGEGKINSIYS